MRCVGSISLLLLGAMMPLPAQAGAGVVTPVPHVEVIGQATIPRVRWRKQLTVLDVVVLAGRLSDADLQQVCILRVGAAATTVLEVDVRAMLRGGDTRGNVVLEPRDLVVVPVLSAAELSTDAVGEDGAAAPDAAPDAAQRGASAAASGVMAVARRLARRDRRLLAEFATVTDREFEAAIATRIQGWRMLFASAPDERLRRIVELGRLGAAAAPAVPHLVEALRLSPRLAGEAATALSLIGAPARSALPALDRLQAHEQRAVRARAAAAARQIRGAVAPR